MIITEDDFDTLKEMAKQAADAFTYGDNVRASGAYRKTLATVYIRRLMEQHQRKERGQSMRLSFRLNGKQIETDVKPDMLLLDLVRELGCYSVKEAVRQQTVVFVLYGWMESRFCHVPHLPFVQMAVM